MAARTAAAGDRYGAGRARAASTGGPDRPPRHATARFHTDDAGEAAETITGLPVRRAGSAARTRRPGSTAARSASSGAARRRTAPRRGAAAPRPGAFQPGGAVQQGAQRAAVRQFRSTSRVLVVEFVFALVLVALKPTEPAPGSDESKASESTIAQLVSVMILFLVLAAVGSAGPRAQRVSNLFGGLVVLALTFKNHGYLTSAVTGLTTKQAAAPNPAPSLSPDEAGGFLPTPSGGPTSAGQAIISGWRGGPAQGTPTASGTPMTSATNPYPGGISGRG